MVLVQEVIQLARHNVYRLVYRLQVVSLKTRANGTTYPFVEWTGENYFGFTDLLHAAADDGYAGLPIAQAYPG